MHVEILDQKRLSLLRQLSQDKLVNNSSFYLAGGTALSLQLGLRKSYDFDFFTDRCFASEVLYHHLSETVNASVKVVNITPNTCDLSINDIQVSFFQYPFNLIRDTIKPQDFPGLRIASIDDIAAMKLSAIGGRGARKDFFDLYYIYQQEGFSTEKMLHILYEKYGHSYNFAYMGMGLGYFQDAESETLPETFVPYDWEKIKSFFLEEQKVFLEKYTDIERCKMPMENQWQKDVATERCFADPDVRPKEDADVQAPDDEPCL